MGAHLLEREAELAALSEASAAARAGRGSVLVVEGPAGIGKSALLNTLVPDEDALTLRARGAEFEREFAYGIARQLFAQHLARRGDEERATLLSGPAAVSGAVLGLEEAGSAAAGDPFAAVYGLYWLVANLADRQPMMLVVDDLHWADEPSLRFLAYLARRCSDLSLLMLLATRPPDPGATALAALLSEAAAVPMRPLTSAAAAELARTTFGRAADPSFVDACQAVTAGNPFLLGQLLTRLEQDGVEPSAGASERVHGIGALDVSRAILAQLGPLDRTAVSLARAVAVLGDGAELQLVLELARLEPDEGARAADHLVRVGVFLDELPLRFVHALVRTAVYVDVPAVDRVLMHARAARLLERGGARADQVAAHLLEAEPAADPWVVTQLRAVARDAVSRGAPDVAGVYLRRALAEPPAPADRAGVLRELAHAENPGQALAIMHEALATASTERERAVIGMELVEMHWRVADFGGAYAVAQRVLAGIADPQTRREVERMAVAAGIAAEPAAVAASAPRLAEMVREDPGDAFLRCFHGVMLISDAESPDPAGARLIVDSLRDAPPTIASIHRAISALLPLAWMEQLELPLQLWRRFLDDARSAARPIAAFIAYTFLSDLHYRSGDLDSAEADARAALELADEHGFPGRITTTTCLMNVLIERGRLDEALPLVAPVPETLYPATYLLEATARLRLTRGEPEAALEDSLECGRRLLGWRRANPGSCPWRSTAALAHLQLGAADEARSLVLDELRLARALELPRAEGIALRALGLIEGGSGGIEQLRASASRLAESVGRLEHARSLVELGGALRRAGSRAEARVHLAEGLDGALRCGATALAERAREELRAAGARPRRDMVTGRDALTPSEQRVARLAAEGLTNREIAQSLFVTPRTVDNHLTRAYQKLGIHSRGELPEALAPT